MTLIRTTHPTDTGPSNRPGKPPSPDDPRRKAWEEEQFRLAGVDRLPFDPEAQARAAARADWALSANATRTQHLPLSPTGIDWQADPYGYDHARHCSELATHIAMGFPRLAPRDVEAVKVAAYLHDLARATPWQARDPTHTQRSAWAASGIMRQDPARWGDATLIEQVCRLIVNHDQPPGGDLTRQCLWDADHYEAARLAPNTGEGAAATERAFSKVTTEWARLPGHQRRWRKHRGWRE